MGRYAPGVLRAPLGGSMGREMMDTRQPFPCPPSPSLLPRSSTLFSLHPHPASPRCGSPFPRRLPAWWSPALGSLHLEAEPPPGECREVLIPRCAGDPAATALRGFTNEIRHSAELPSVIVPHTIRGCAGNFGAADRYTALIQLSLQPLLAKIRGNWYYK